MQQQSHRSTNRYSRKRNSHDSVAGKIKKPLPKVFIDLHEKSKQLTIHNDFNSKISADSKLKQKSINIERTDHLKKNTAADYRADYEELATENAKLKDQNILLRENEKYLARQLKQAKKELCEEYSNHKQIQSALSSKLEEYIARIESLYKELIQAKKKQHSIGSERNHGNPIKTTFQNNSRQIPCPTNMLYSHRNKYENIENQSPLGVGMFDSEANRKIDSFELKLKKHQEEGELSYLQQRQLERRKLKSTHVKEQQFFH